MKAFKELITDKYLGIPSLEALHLESKEWLNDVAFWADEADFLKKLIDQNFVHLMMGERLTTIVELSKQVEHMKDVELKNLKELIEIHEARLAGFMAESYFHQEEKYRKEHGQLAGKVREMALKTMALKRRIFGAMENFKMAEKMKALKG